VGWWAAQRLGGSIIEFMVIDMNEVQVRTLEQVRQVLAGTQAMQFQATADDEGRCAWIAYQRWRIERDYQDLKPDFGLGPYEGRGWRGLHHQPEQRSLRFLDGRSTQGRQT